MSSFRASRVPRDVWRIDTLAPGCCGVPPRSGALAAPVPRAVGARALELAVERLAVDAEDARRDRLVAPGRLEHALDVALLHLGERHEVARVVGRHGER